MVVYELVVCQVQLKDVELARMVLSCYVKQTRDDVRNWRRDMAVVVVVALEGRQFDAVDVDDSVLEMPMGSGIETRVWVRARVLRVCYEVTSR